MWVMASNIQNDLGTGAVTIKQVGQWGVQDYWAEGNYFSHNYEGGLRVVSNGAVTVAFWQAVGNLTDGIYIDNDGGSGAVSITGTSNYWDNLAYNHDNGLELYAKGNITLSKIQANGNWTNGALLRNYNGTGNVTLTDASFDFNGWRGLDINTKGVVSWKNGSVIDNFDYGAYILDTGAGKAVTLTNVNASSNGETGIFVDSLGAVTMTEVESNNNSANYYWAYYEDWWKDNLNDDQVWNFTGSIGDDVTLEISSGRFQPWVYVTDPNGDSIGSASDLDEDGTITLTISDLAENGDYQIHIGSNSGWNGNSYEMKLYEGAVEPSTWNPMESAANGIYVDNHNGTGAVSISNSSNRWMGNNSGTGVVVVSSGAVTLKGMDLNDSRQGGAWINNQDVNKAGAPGVTLTNVNFYNNDMEAAWIWTEGPVVISNGDQSGNWSYGYDINNTYGTALSPITMTNVSLNNWGTTETGVYLRSDGTVTLTNVNSNGNGGPGFDIDATGAVKFTQVGGYGNDGYGAHVVTDGAFTVVGSTNGSTWFTNNSGTGLLVEAGGAISLTKVYTGDNGWRDEITGDPTTYGNGIYLTSTNALGTAPITLSDVTSNNNTLDGLHIDTNGAVTVNTLKVENNTEYGLYLDQTGAPDSLKAIILNLVTANSNGMDGVYVYGKGNITANTFIVNLNGDSGMVLDNRNAGGTGTVTMLNTLGNKYNVAVANGDVGVFIESKGAVTINQLESIYNTLDGLDIQNNYSLKPAVTLNNVITRYNLVGMDVRSDGVVTINTSWSTNNAHDGIAVHTNNNVNILNTASTMNGWSGIWAENTVGTWTLKLTGSAWFGNLRDVPGVLDPDYDPLRLYKNLELKGNWNVVY